MSFNDFQRKASYYFVMLYSLIKPILFSLDPEMAHNFTLDLARLCPTLGAVSGTIPSERLQVKVGSVMWRSPLGLAAGLDKNADALRFFSQQGFGAIECGTITMRPQDGNPRPRMFRYPEEKSLRNAMGFPNQGLLSILPKLKGYSDAATLGANIGKNKDTSPEESIEELNLVLETLLQHASYFVINVSSPNTPGLRALQEKSYLSELFSELNKTRCDKDLYLKIAPDLEFEKIHELTQLCREFKLTGLIATNTTIMPGRGAGGISGVLLREKSKSVRNFILKEKGDLELISVGGITTPDDVFDLWASGGKAFQVYTSYVYQGPDLLKNFYRKINQFLEIQNISLEDFFNLKVDERHYRINQRNRS